MTFGSVRKSAEIGEMTLTTDRKDANGGRMNSDNHRMNADNGRMDLNGDTISCDSDRKVFDRVRIDSCSERNDFGANRMERDGSATTISPGRMTGDNDRTCCGVITMIIGDDGNLSDRTRKDPAEENIECAPETTNCNSSATMIFPNTFRDEMHICHVVRMRKRSLPYRNGDHQLTEVKTGVFV